jgi:hypothetical protein
MPDMLANRITTSFANIVNVVPLAREGKLRALSITSIKRSVLAPDVPTARRVAPPDDRLRITKPPVISLSVTIRRRCGNRGASG